MTGTTGTCPSCGAPVEFSLGTSIAKVCEYCRATVCRTDHSLEDIGKVALPANTPSLVAVGDFGKLDADHIQILGRVQLDHGSGPWDEYYVSFNHGSSWGWLAYAEGNWLLTRRDESIDAPPLEPVTLEQDIALGDVLYRVTEIKTARVLSAEGELPSAIKPGDIRRYIDLVGPGGECATIDYGAEGATPEVFTGWVVSESRFDVTKVGLREGHRVSVDHLECPSCGGDIHRHTGERAQRIGCPFCGSLCDLALNQVIDKQQAAYEAPFIPIGSRGTLFDQEFTCIAVIEKQADFDGELFTWQEFLLFAEGTGFRWLIKDETTWLWVTPVNAANVDLGPAPRKVVYENQVFDLRNQQTSRVRSVVGEVYWQVRAGETTKARDYHNGHAVLSREQGPGEVRWSISTPIPWRQIAEALSLPQTGGAGQFGGSNQGVASAVNMGAVIMIGFIVLILCCVGFGVSSSSGPSSVGAPVIIFGGSGGFSGGK